MRRPTRTPRAHPGSWSRTTPSTAPRSASSRSPASPTARCSRTTAPRAINNGDFITYAQANAGLKFTPAADFNGDGSFDVQASTSNTDAGLGGSVQTATITVNPVNDAPTLTAHDRDPTLCGGRAAVRQRQRLGRTRRRVGAKHQAACADGQQCRRHRNDRPPVDRRNQRFPDRRQYRDGRRSRGEHLGRACRRHRHGDDLQARRRYPRRGRRRASSTA